MNSIVGQTTAIVQPLSYEYRRREGFTVMPRFAGTPQAMLGLSTTLQLAGIDHAYRSEGSQAFIEILQHVTDGSAEKPFDTWQVLVNEVQKDIFEHPSVLAMELANPGTIGVIRKALEAYNESTADSLYTFTSAVPGATTLFSLLVHGTTHYAYCQYVLKHTQTVSDNYKDNVADVNINKLYTTAQLLEECATFAQPIVPRLITKISEIVAPAPVDGYLWSWRKLGGSEENSAKNKVQINNEYWLELWSTFLYSPVV